MTTRSGRPDAENLPAGSPVSEPEFFRSLVESSPEITAVIDERGEVLYASPAAVLLLGCDPAGTPFVDLVHPADRERVHRFLNEARALPAFRAHDEARVRSASGGYRWVQSIGRRLREGPAAGHFLIQLRDVTDRRDAEERLRHAEQRLQRVVEGLPLILFAIDLEGVFTLSEGRGLETVGLQPGQLEGHDILESFPDVPEVARQVRRALAGESVRYRAAAGGRVWDTQLAPVRDEDGIMAGALGVSLDVTESTEQERAAAFQALLLDTVGQAVIAADREGRIIYWNRGAEALYGWTREEALEMDATALDPGETGQTGVRAIMDELREGGAWSGEYTALTKDGERVPVLLTSRPVLEDGEVVGMLGVSSDLRELKRLEERLRQAQKMEAVGRLAGGVAHDFNNILTAIGGYAGMAADRVGDPQVAADIAEVVRATDRARGLVDKLLAFSRRGRVVPRPLDPNQLIRELTPLLRRTLPSEVRMTQALDADAWLVRSDPRQLEQALLNLVLNARDAMPEGGTLSVRTDNVVLDAPAAAGLDEALSAGDYVRLTIQDTGIGMDAAVKARIFEPFFTTKKVGKGTGLGLSTVFGAVRHLGGGIQVHSAPGAGARFCLYLPRSEQTTETPGTPSEPAPKRAVEGASILLVEDELAVRRLAQRILAREGCRVVEAGTGVEALRAVEEGLVPDLVLTDVIMPEMGGAELVDRLRVVRPGVLVLFMSGYTAEELADRGVEATAAFLPKPFAPAALVERVREMLGQAPA